MNFRNKKIRLLHSTYAESFQRDESPAVACLRYASARTLRGFSCFTIIQIHKSPFCEWAFMYLAESEGFEPSVGYKPTPAFQASSLSHSDNFPYLIFREGGSLSCFYIPNKLETKLKQKMTVLLNTCTELRRSMSNTPPTFWALFYENRFTWKN